MANVQSEILTLAENEHHSALKIVRNYSAPVEPTTFWLASLHYLPALFASVKVVAETGTLGFNETDPSPPLFSALRAQFCAAMTTTTEPLTAQTRCKLKREYSKCPVSRHVAAGRGTMM